MSNPTEAALLKPGGLAKRLRQLREDSGMTGSALAEKLGWPQPRISKIETGKQIPPEDDVRAYALAAGADDEIVQELLELREQANAISRAWRHGRSDGQAAIQSDYDAMVRQATVIRNAEVTTIPGLLQTPDYAHHQAMQAVILHGFDLSEIDATVAVRMRRQDVLYDTAKQFEFVITEASLRLLYCPVDAMLAQLDRLLGVTFGRPGLWFGIIPFGVELPIVPQNRFIALDDLVLIEDFAGDYSYREERAMTYVKAMDLMKDQAVTGEAARELILAAMGALR